MIELKLSGFQFSEIIKKGYDLNMIFLLKLLLNGEDVMSNVKIDSIKATMVRKGLIKEDSFDLTVEGKELLEWLSEEEKDVKITKKRTKKNEPFDLWWEEYPISDTFTYKGKSFKGTRALRVKKEDCRVKIATILNSGEYTIEELIQALKLEKEQKAENSYKTGVNKMTYFQGSSTYLHQNTYDSYVELVRQGHKAKENKDEKSLSNGVDI